MKEWSDIFLNIHTPDRNQIAIPTTNNLSDCLVDLQFGYKSVVIRGSCHYH